MCSHSNGGTRDSKNALTHSLIVTTVFLWLSDSFFSFQNNSQNLEPSYKIDLDLWDCFRSVKHVL